MLCPTVFLLLFLIHKKKTENKGKEDGTKLYLFIILTNYVVSIFFYLI